MIDFPTNLKHISLPIYDIILLISLGYDGPTINHMLRKCYKIFINFRTIYSSLKKFWGDWDKILEKFFKPVLQGLLGHPDNFNWQEIAITLRRHPSYQNKKNFHKWFFGLNITNLKELINRNDFNWENFEKLAKELISDINDDHTIKGISKEHWIEWFIKDIGMDSISSILGYKNSKSLASSWKKQNRSKSIFQKQFADTYTDAVIKYRKSRTIELLTSEDFIDTLLDSRLYWIYINEFGFKKWQDLSISRPSQGKRNCIKFFKKLFRQEKITIEMLEIMKPIDLNKFKHLIVYM